jgi:NAD(P)-dependent dehydrogenase (short-subunit alcohol dehydrogenase family)
LTERSAIVTGASGGIGGAVTQSLVQHGFAVTAAAREPTRLAAAVARVDPSGERVVGMPGDAGDGAFVATLVDAHVERNGGVDVVVACAGGGRQGTVAASTSEDIERALRLNTVGPMLLARAALPALRAAGARHAGAWFIVIASISGLWPTKGFAAYSASKAAAISMARSLSLEEGEAGVRACAICPAFVDTAMTAWTGEKVPNSTKLRSEDVMEAVSFLLRLSPAAVVTEIVMGRAGAGLLSP